MASKVCTRCRTDKPLDDFHGHGDGRLRADCKTCWNAAKAAKARATRAAQGCIVRRPTGDTTIADGVRVCTECNVAKPATSEHFHRGARYRGGLRSVCKSCCVAQTAKWTANNRDRMREWVGSYLAANPQVRMAKNVARRVYSALRDGKKQGPTFDLLGYSPADLARHLERTMLPGMTWDNYGDWHIDHILPLSLFDHADPDMIRQAWALSNLRALWKADNLAKGDNIEVLL